LDGELWCGHDDRQSLVSAVKKHVPVEEQWRKVKYMVFDSPLSAMWLAPRTIKNTHNKTIIPSHARDWYINHGGRPGLGLIVHDEGMFKAVPGICELAEQTQLPMMTSELLTAIKDKLKIVLAKGGEGLMFRNPRTPWIPERTYDLLKYKPIEDCEVEVIGFSWGKETDKGSRHLGRMGALHVKEGNKTFLVAGFNDVEREILNDGVHTTKIRYAPNDEFSSYRCQAYGIKHAGKTNENSAMVPAMFPIGKVITIKHRGRTKDGIPVEARYWRDYVG
jgi:DNA ligase-1